MNIDKLLAEKAAGINLDIGCGANKQGDDWVGMDIRDLPGVDIVHDVNVHPWPLPDECVRLALTSHLIEHIPPVMVDRHGTWFPFMAFMDEVWRIMRVGGEFMSALPHGSSQRFIQDPTHCNMVNETTWDYFCPERKSGLWHIYKPKPWRIKHLFANPAADIEVVLIKVILAEADDDEA